MPGGEPQRLIVGRVVKPHGIRGEVTVEVLSDVPDRFAPGRSVWFGPRRLTVADVREHQGRMLVLFEEIPDRNAADDLRGATLEIPLEEAAPLSEGSFYAFQLEGLRVVDEHGAPLGTLARVEPNPGNDLWIVDTGDGEVMVPAVRQIVIDVDLEAGRITVAPPEGLFR